MKIKINPDQHSAFLKACRLADSVAIGRTTLPILSAALLTTQKRSVTIQANNLDEAVVAEFEADVMQNGQCALSARDLAKIAGLSDMLELEATKQEANIKGGGKFRLAIMPVEDFPPLPQMDKVKPVAFTGAELQKALSVVYCASQDVNRYILQGVCLDLASKFGVATDGRRLALSDPDCPKAGESKTVPTRACKMLLALSKDAPDKSFEVAFSESAVRVESDELSFYGKLIEGNFPNFRMAIPKLEHAVKIERAAFLSALDRFSFIEWDVAKVELRLTKDGGSIKGQGKKTRAEVEFELAIKLSGPELKIGFDPNYLRDAIASMNEKEITFEYTDDLTAVAIKADGLAIVMPMRI